MSADGRSSAAVILTWLALTTASAWVYVQSGVRNDSSEEYTRLWDFQVLAFFYTRWLFWAAGVVVSLLVAKLKPLRSLRNPTLARIGISTGVFLVTETLARAVWGR